jgi:2,3-bisphosphoglycerate-independent phosphoglycerate mutase
MACILIILDGIGDRSYPELGNQTPLQAAATPVLDQLAGSGANGLMHATGDNAVLTSENAHFSLFGYHQEDFPGRGYLEAVGAGIPLENDDVAILARISNVVPSGGHLVLQKNWPKAVPAEISAINASISDFQVDNTRFEYIPTSGTQGILVIRGPASRCVTDSNPILEGRKLMQPQPWEEPDNAEMATRTARALNKYLLWCHRQLEQHPVNRDRTAKGLLPLNAMITNRAGQYRRVESFGERWGLRSLSISSGLIYHGLARFLGMEVLQVKDSSDPGADLAARAEMALARLDDYDFIHVHTKAPDAASHSKNTANKIAAIESLDRGMAKVSGRLLAGNDNLVVITADHSTPCTEPLIHSGEPVPVTALGRGMRRDRVGLFNEIDCAGGSLGFIDGRYFMHFVLNGLDQAKLSGLMDNPRDQPYWPGRSVPLSIDG